MGGGTVTNLWTIADKTTPYDGDVTLAQAIENFDEVMITFRSSISETKAK